MMSVDLCGLVPHARQHAATVVSQRELARHTYAVRIRCPAIARAIIPGQFLMIRPAGGTDPLLGRPFALYDTVLGPNGEAEEFEFAYHVVGKLTGLMSHWEPGQAVDVWGPLGNGFPVYSGKHLLCVGGGIGYTPFLAVAREALGLRRYPGRELSNHEKTSPRVEEPQTASPRVTLCYGVQTKSARADLSDFEPLKGLSIHISTDDGTEGRQGFVTQVVADLFASPAADRPDGVYCCGPEPMMRAVAKLCAQAGIACWLSLETPMACGFGACFSCVTRVRDASAPEGWDYRRTCVEGPVFRADELMLA